MKNYYIIEYYQKGTKHWTRHNFINYSSFVEAEKEVKSYKEHKLSIKFRILQVKVVAS